MTKIHNLVPISHEQQLKGLKEFNVENKRLRESMKGVFMFFKSVVQERTFCLSY